VGSSAFGMYCSVIRNISASGCSQSRIFAASERILSTSLRSALMYAVLSSGALVSSAGVSEHDRVVIHVRHSRFRVDALGDVVRVQRGRQADADVDELPDAAGCHVTDGAPEELPVLPGHLRGDRVDRQHLLREFAVGGEVVLPAEQIIIVSGSNHMHHAGYCPSSPQTT
jgi:hypothetical protein